MKWYEIQIKTTEEAEDAIANFLYEMGVNGVVIEDNQIVTDPSVSWDYIDENMLVHKDYAIIRAYFPESINITEILYQIKEGLKNISKYLDVGLNEMEISQIDEEDWANEWKKYYKPIEVDDIVIVPSWEKYEQIGQKHIVFLDPGMAFGTGNHETTMMCIKLLQKYIKSNVDVIDVGCGTGILSIVSKKLGANYVLAVDIDDVAVKSAQINTQLNNVDIDVKKNDLIKGIINKFDIVIANIVADVIINLSMDVKNIIKENGLFIASGIIHDRLDDVLKASELNGIEHIEIMNMNDWYAIVGRVR